jgi:hypothetical protein
MHSADLVDVMGNKKHGAFERSKELLIEFRIIDCLEVKLAAGPH